MKSKKWKLLKSKTVINNKWLKVSRNSYKTPKGKVIPEFYIHEGDNEALIFCLTKDNKVILEVQWRPGVGKISWDLPGGRIDKDDKNPKEAVKRELFEETGYKAKSLKFVGSFSKNPSNSKNLAYVYFTKNVQKVTEPKLDHGEDIKVKLVPLREVTKYTKSGGVSCTFCMSAIYLVLDKMNLLK